MSAALNAEDVQVSSWGRDDRPMAERSSWTEGARFLRPDGTKYDRKRDASRWAGSFAVGEWFTVEVAS